LPRDLEAYALPRSCDNGYLVGESVVCHLI
jgi:hypothetical protein